MLLVVIYHPLLAGVFATVPLNLSQWAPVILVAVIPAVINNIIWAGKGIVAPRVFFVKKNA